jgi:hypothetical protein
MTTLVLNVLEHDPSIDLLIALCGRSVLKREFKADAAVREVLDASSGKIRLRSSVAGQFILTQCANPNTLVTVLAKMARSADVYAENGALPDVVAGHGTAAVGGVLTARTDPGTASPRQKSICPSGRDARRVTDECRYRLSSTQ